MAQDIVSGGDVEKHIGQAMAKQKCLAFKGPRCTGYDIVNLGGFLAVYVARLKGLQKVY